MTSSPFSDRHIGLSQEDTEKMLSHIGEDNIDQLIDKTIPAAIRLDKKLSLSDPMSEYQYLNHLRNTASENQLVKTYIGLGYYNTKVPAVIQRNILENPGWYTAYTPYQAEIAQGRLEALLNFQTMVSDLTAMDLANSSLLDEPTAVAEAMSLMFNSRSRDMKKEDVRKLFVDENCFPQTIDVLQTRSQPLGIELIIGNPASISENERVFGLILQYPSKNGEAIDFEGKFPIAFQPTLWLYQIHCRPNTYWP